MRFSVSRVSAMVDPKQGLARPSAIPTTTLGRKWWSIHPTASRDQIPGTAMPR